MKAAELRIGNLLMWQDESEDIIAVTAINLLEDYNEGYIATSNNEQAKLDEFEPIPITGEWLLKFGFEEDSWEDAVWYQKDFPFIGELCTSDREHPLGNFLFDTETDTLRIFYVHQLQNLYFALTGKELEIIKHLM